MSKILDALKAAEQKHQVEEAKYREYMAKSERERRNHKETSAGWVGSCARVRPGDYAMWLEDFLRSGGEITHVYDYDMPCDSWLLARIDFTVTPLYGSAAKSIIVPAGVRVEVGAAGAGHNEIFYHDGHRAPGIVPLYSDISAMLQEQVDISLYQ